MSGLERAAERQGTSGQGSVDVGSAPTGESGEVARARTVGDVYFDAGRYADASAQYARALEHLSACPASPDEAVGLCLQMGRCDVALGRNDDARLWCRRIEILNPGLEGEALADTQVLLADVDLRSGRFESAREAARRALAALGGREPTPLLGRVMERLGHADAELGNLDGARAWYAECLSTWRILGHELGQATAFNNLGIVAKRCGDSREALDCFRRALDVYRKLARPPFLANCLRNMGLMLFRLSRWLEAEEHLRESRAIFSVTGQARDLAGIDLALARMAEARGEWGRAEELLRDVLETSRKEGYVKVEVLALTGLARLEHDRQEEESALSHAGSALEMASRMASGGDVWADALVLKSEILLSLGEAEQAEHAANEVVMRSRELGDRHMEGIALREFGNTRFARGDTAGGERLLAAGEAALGAVGDSFEMAKCAVAEAGAVAKSLPRDRLTLDRLDAKLSAASELFVKIGARHWAGRADVLRGEILLAAGRLDRARACVVLARQRMEALRDERAVARACALLGEIDSRIGLASASPGSRLAVITRGYELIRLPDPSVSHIHEMAMDVAAAVTAERLILAQVKDGSTVSPVTSVDLAGRGMSHAMASVRDYVRTHGAGCPLVVASDARAPQSAGRRTASAVIPAASDTGASYVLYVDRSGGDGSAAFSEGDVEFLGAASHLLAVAHARARALSAADRTGAPGVACATKASSGVVTRDAEMLRILDVVDHLGTSSVPVLIRGESGTGKELIARAVHQAGRAKTGDFVALNASAIAPHLQESELFGHVRGSFTDAHHDREGLVAAAARGTLFLDEIGEMSSALQVKLLRFLDQAGEYRRVGENTIRRSDARVISATNKDLVAEMKAGRFRNDLLYRLNTETIDLPPLRERRGDVELLMDHFLDLHSRREGKRITGFSRDARELFLLHDWSENNVRELENEIRRAIAVSNDGQQIGLDVISPALRARYSGLSRGRRAPRSLKEEERELERRRILEALESSSWNVKRAAGILGISRTGLHTKMRKHGIG